MTTTIATAVAIDMSTRQAKTTSSPSEVTGSGMAKLCSVVATHHVGIATTTAATNP
jgi:hypothetical protein